MPQIQATLRWGADYLMACHTADDRFVAQAPAPKPSSRPLL